MFESARLATTFPVYDGAARVAGPVEYPLSCSPQAGRVPLLLRAILGMQPDPNGRRLLADLVLPEGGEDLRLEDVPTYGGRFSLGK